MLGMEVGVLGCGKRKMEGRVTVAYMGFLRDYTKSPFCKELSARCQVLMDDELQMLTPSLFPFLKQCKSAYFRYGFSGSFFDNDDFRVLSTSGYFGATITKVTDVDIVAVGRGVPAEFHFYEYPIRKKASYEETYGSMYTDEIVNNEEYNRFFVKLLIPHYDKQESILITAKQVQHLKNIQEACGSMGMDSELYHGQLEKGARNQRRLQFKSGKIPILIATEQTFGVGMNIPRIQTYLNLGGGLSDDKAIQRWGRSLRSFTDESIEKLMVTVIEPMIVGNAWFAKHSRARLKVAQSYESAKVFVHKWGYMQPIGLSK
jgi:superfamily II DNA or RNA helicase